MKTTPNVLFIKAAIVLLIFCFAESAVGSKYPKGSCIKYGHSCWGAHGKRNGGGSAGGGGGNLIRIGEQGPVANTRWYLSRLVQAPAELRMWRDEQERHIMSSRSASAADRRGQNDSEIETELTKRAEETDDLETRPETEPETEEVVLMEEPNLGQKLRLYKLMKKNTEKLN